MTDRKLGNWLQGYRDFTSGTESPPIFHLWVAMGTIAGAAQRKIYMDAGHYKVHSNMYIILVSPPGRSRKSTALRIGQGILEGLVDYGTEIHFSTQATSVAALVQQLKNVAEKSKAHQSITTFSSELGTFLGSKSVEMTDFLTDIYDASPGWNKQTVGRGLEKIPYPWLNMLAATTPQWMGDNLSKTAVEGGFVSRSIFVFEDTRLRVAFPELTDEQKKLRQYLLHDLSIIAKLEGQFTFGKGAKEFYTDWYENKAGSEENVDHRVSGYYERKHIHVLKTAMALSLAANNSLELDVRDIETALALLAEIEPGMKRAFSSVGKNQYGTVMERIATQMRERGTLTYKQIVAATINDVEEKILNELLQTLISLGDIDLVKDGGPRRYRWTRPNSPV